MPRRAKKSLAGLRAKYGATVRKRYTRVMQTLKAKRRCPSCGSWNMKRQAVGIWTCSSCDYKVAGGAYDLATSTR
ncbi:MAG: 50S ribosomal protein L37 [Thaumarchaeota archaeon]|nr:50S ribosomal protein L37 [Nitrososphaerota archaeon]